MNAKLKARWIKALRSGRYKRGTGALCRVSPKGNKKFCCLGVLCDIEHVKFSDPDSQYGARSYSFGRAGHSLDFLRGRLGKAVGEEAQQTLAEMNDAPRGSFKRIANWIEKNL